MSLKSLVIYPFFYTFVCKISEIKTQPPKITNIVFHKIFRKFNKFLFKAEN